MTIYVTTIILTSSILAIITPPDPTVRAQYKHAVRRTWRFETPETVEREIYLLLQHLSGELIHELATLLRPAGVTPEQYHVLRILQDAGIARVVAQLRPLGVIKG